LTYLRVGGGGAANSMCMLFQADLWGVPGVRPGVLETTALGVAYLAGLAVGFWKDRNDIAHQWQVDNRFTPNMPTEEISTLKQGWQKALDRSRNWADS
jgi:glycerol kinase